MVSSPLALRENVEPAHKTNSHFAPTYRKVVNLPGLLKAKRLNEWWKTKLKGTANKRELKGL